MSSTKVHPQTTATKKNSVTVQTILEDFRNLDPSLYTQCADALKADEAAMNVLSELNARLGFVPTAEHIAAKLPPELHYFDIIKEEETVDAALTDPAFVAAQQAMQSAPNDPKNLTVLQTEVTKLIPIYTTAIQTRLKEENLAITCRKVIIAGNEDFEQVYFNMWEMIVKADEKGVEETKAAIAAIFLLLAKISVKQTTRNPAVLLQHAASIQPTYKKTILEIAATVDGVKTSIPLGLKKMGRIIEKTILKRKDDPGNADQVCDIVRGMVECTNMSQIAAIVNCFQTRSDLTVTRVKDRFFKAPSAGGWRDIMINFYLNSDSNKHICELQLVHTQMMTARKGLPGHAVYNRVRNASELLLLMDIHEQPKDKKELQEWLIEYHCGKDWKKGDPKNGDIFTRGHPNLWDVSLITDMYKLFDYKKGLGDFNENISNWNVSNVTKMKSMFRNSETFNQPIDKWDVSNVLDMMGMFEESRAFNQPIDKWDVSKVTAMNNMFRESQVFNQPIDRWDVSKVTNMGAMFRGNKAFNQPIGEWDVLNVTEMKSMFAGSKAFKQILPDEWKKKASYTRMDPRDEKGLLLSAVAEPGMSNYVGRKQ